MLKVPAVAFTVSLPMVNWTVGRLTLKVCEADVPPPGAGVSTVIWAVLTVVRSAAGMTAVS